MAPLLLPEIYARRGRLLKTEKLIKERKQSYLNYQVIKAKERGGLGNRFAALTKPFSSVNKTPNFDVKDVCGDGATDLQAAEECADYFSAISDEFVPLNVNDLPETFSVRLTPVTHLEIAARLRSFKKSRWMVPGDIFPQLVSHYAVSLS